MPTAMRWLRIIVGGEPVTQPKIRKSKNPALVSPQNGKTKDGAPLEFVGLRGLVAIVIVLVPVAVGAPAAFMFIPPAVTFAPATLARLVQFTALVICLGAVASMSLDSP